MLFVCNLKRCCAQNCRQELFAISESTRAAVLRELSFPSSCFLGFTRVTITVTWCWLSTYGKHVSVRGLVVGFSVFFLIQSDAEKSMKWQTLAF